MVPSNGIDHPQRTDSMTEAQLDREALAAAADAVVERLIAADVRAVALTFVDNAGIARARAVPVDRFADAVAWGVGSSPVHDVFCVDDVITTSPLAGGPVGDLRLHPDLAAVTILAGQPGWAWAPVDRWNQDGTPYAGDQRGFARRAIDRAAAAGISVSMGFEHEWFLARADGGIAAQAVAATAHDAVTHAASPGAHGGPASTGPAYGMTGLVELSDYSRDLLEALSAQGVPVLQLHPEYATGQLELSTAPTDPLAAADRAVLVRETIRALSLRHGLRASFAPVPVAEAVGNGMHLHLSVRDDAGTNLFVGGDGPHGLTERGESIVAGVLSRVAALSGIGAPSLSSHLRLVPQRWAGAYQCWGLENREAALRLVRGVDGARERAANLELKCVDGSANPYLIVGAVALVMAESVDAGLRLPEEVDVDPASLPIEQQPPRLPETVPGGLAALAADEGLTEALGPTLLGAFTAVHRSEWERGGRRSPVDIARGVRWRY
jgi:glutamine synthetase